MARYINPTIFHTIEDYLETVLLARSKRTFTTYRNGLRSFQETLTKHGLDPAETKASKLPEEAISWFAQDLKSLSPASERLYLTAASNLYEYMAAENIENQIYLAFDSSSNSEHDARVFASPNSQMTQ